jgi:hypothetical protein
VDGNVVDVDIELELSESDGYREELSRISVEIALVGMWPLEFAVNAWMACRGRWDEMLRLVCDEGGAGENYIQPCADRKETGHRIN